MGRVRFLFCPLLAGAFVALNRYVIKWRMNWWKNIALSIGLWLLGVLLLVLLIRIQ